MSLQRFEGWEPLTETVYEYDDDGRVSRTLSRPEPEWDSEQRALMLALALAESGECPGCGNPLGESTDRANEGRWEVPPPTRCHACTAVGVAHEGYREVKQPTALRFGTTLKREEHRVP